MIALLATILTLTGTPTTATDDGCLVSPAHAVCLEDTGPAIVAYSTEPNQRPADWQERVSVSPANACIDTPANGSACLSQSGFSLTDAWGNDGCLSAEIRSLSYRVCTDGRTFVGLPGDDAHTYSLPANVWLWSMQSVAGTDARLGA